MIKGNQILVMVFIFLRAVDEIEVIAWLAISAAIEVTRQTQYSLKCRLSRILPRHLAQCLFGWIRHYRIFAQ